MWVGPTQITGPGTNLENNGPISAQNSWADLGPTYFLSLFFWAGPDPAQTFGLGQN
jgi:hypothetical protein